MKNIKWFLVWGIVISMAPISEGADGGSVTRRGSSVLHYMTRNTVAGTDLGPNTTGSLRLQFNEQGQSRKESLQLSVAGLETNASPGLTAAMGEDTNVVLILNLTTDNKGQTRVSYLSQEPPRARLPRGKEPLPDSLSPVTDIRAICVENSSEQVVGFAWIRDATTFQYLVKRNLTPADTNGTAAGSISLIANPRHVNFRLLAGGLSPGTDYSLALNSTVVATATANENGRLQIKGWPANAPLVLDLRSLSLLAAGGNVVLSTTLPR